MAKVHLAHTSHARWHRFIPSQSLAPIRHHLSRVPACVYRDVLPCDLPRRTGQFEMVAIEDVSLLNAASLEQFDGVLFTSRELPVSKSQNPISWNSCGVGRASWLYTALNLARLR